MPSPWVAVGTCLCFAFCCLSMSYLYLPACIASDNHFVDCLFLSASLLLLPLPVGIFLLNPKMIDAQQARLSRKSLLVVPNVLDGPQSNNQSAVILARKKTHRSAPAQGTREPTSRALARDRMDLPRCQLLRAGLGSLRPLPRPSAGRTHPAAWECVFESEDGQSQSRCEFFGVRC